MAFKALDADEIKLTWGTFRMVRHALGATAFGPEPDRLPASGKVGPEHDELQSGQEEVYYTLSGSGTLTIDGERVEMRPGRYILVSTGREAESGGRLGGMSFICIGGAPGGVTNPGRRRTSSRGPPLRAMTRR